MFMIRFAQQNTAAVHFQLQTVHFVLNSGFRIQRKTGGQKTLANKKQREKTVKEDKLTNKEKKKVNWHETLSTMKRYYLYTIEYFWQWGVWRFVGGFGSASVGLLFNYRLGKVVDVIIGNDWNVAVKSIIMLISLAVFRMIIGYTNSLTAYRYDILSGRKLRKKAMERINSLPIGYFESKHTGEVISRVVNDIDKLQSYYSDSIAACGAIFRSTRSWDSGCCLQSTGN